MKKQGPLTLTVFGATGRTGRPLVQQALEQGHQVIALVRDPAKLGLQHERLKVLQGDLTRPEQVEAAIAGADAVLSAAGHVPGCPKDLLAQAARAIIPAMKKHGVGRLVTLLGAGVPDPSDPGSFGRKLMLGVMKLVARDMLEDAEAHARLVRDSGLEWTIVRPPRLTEGPRKGQYRTGHLALGPSAQLSRADLAEFMLRQVTDGTFVRQAPMVSY
jgi:putative NADH-flavin reductase